MSDATEPTLFESRIVRGQAAHTCCECLIEIPKGDSHYWAKGMWEGKWATYRRCMPCVDRVAAEETGYYRVAFGELMECYGYSDQTPEQERWLNEREQRRG
jgi:hypothetical protein